VYTLLLSDHCVCYDEENRPNKYMDYYYIVLQLQSVEVCLKFLIGLIEVVKRWVALLSFKMGNKIQK
jgi:hypothetical protein